MLEPEKEIQKWKMWKGEGKIGYSCLFPDSLFSFELFKEDFDIALFFEELLI